MRNEYYANRFKSKDGAFTIPHLFRVKFVNQEERNRMKTQGHVKLVKDEGRVVIICI